MSDEELDGVLRSSDVSTGTILTHRKPMKQWYQHGQFAPSEEAKWHAFYQDNLTGFVRTDRIRVFVKCGVLRPATDEVGVYLNAAVVMAEHPEPVSNAPR